MTEEGEGEGEEQRGGDGLRNGENIGGQSLFIIHIAEHWRMQKTAKKKEKRKGRSSATIEMMEAGGEKELLFSDR